MDAFHQSSADADVSQSMSSPSLSTRAWRSLSWVFRSPVAFTLSSALSIPARRVFMLPTNLSRVDVNGAVLTG